MATESNTLKAFDARKLMEIAVEVMKESIPEDRGDAKVPPAVGAVIWFPDEKRYETAYRGELRDGDHGEYTLLERKLAGRKLDNCILFTTLEPCMERNPPKICCARRIILARIKTVYVGIQDPDKSVDGEGIRYLESRGVKVNPFDREFQEEIERVNAKFIENANERRKEAENDELYLPPTLLQSKADHFDRSAFSQKALSQFREVAGIAEPVDSDEFRQRLQQLVVMDKSGEPTNNGIILFGMHPREAMVDSGVLGTIHYENGSDESKNFDGPQVLVPEQILKWLRDKLPKPDDRVEAKRVDRDAEFFKLVREGIVNAIVHRDYSVSGAKIQVSATADSLTIKSPGAPVEPITIEQLQSLNAPMRSRNPTLHYIFSRMRLAEERGLGLKSMKLAAEKAGLPRPEFSWEEPYLVLRLYRSTDAVEKCLPPKVLKELNAAEVAGYAWMKTQGWVTRPDYAESQKLEQRAAGLHLKEFFDLGIVERQGKGRATKHRAK